MFEELRRSAWPRWLSHGPGEPSVQTPLLDVLDEEGEIVVRAELPGVSKDDIDVRVTNATLTIKAEKRQEKKVERTRYYFGEREFGSIFRAIELPAVIKSAAATASFRDGVLEIHLPKTEEAKRRAVRVQVN